MIDQDVQVLQGFTESQHWIQYLNAVFIMPKLLRFSCYSIEYE